jgi:hypothetical protein
MDVQGFARENNGRGFLGWVIGLVSACTNDVEVYRSCSFIRVLIMTNKCTKFLAENNKKFFGPQFMS